MINVGPCCQCKTTIYLPQELHDAARRGAEQVTFYCPYGHPQVFAKGETEADRFRRERDLLAQRIAERDDRIKALREEREAAERRAAAARGQVTKIKNRVGAGVCPCCTRSFSNLRRHMETQHSDYRAEAAE